MILLNANGQSQYISILSESFFATFLFYISKCVVATSIGIQFLGAKKLYNEWVFVISLK